jgi:tetratricopeptide (TPR) repeat protein
MSEDIEQLLYDGALALTQGRRAEAQELLMRVIELDEQNEQAWLWLSGAVDDPADQQIALENVLALNPNNAAAQEGLRWLRARA